MESNAETETIVLAGGCFWGMQELFRQRPGVVSTRVGYCGGSLDRPGYRDVCAGNTGHAEALEVVFDPGRTTLRALLEFFFQIHDPTTPDRQGNDRGSQYRSAIFVANESQRKIAETTIADIERSGIWPGDLVTQVVPAGTFWEAEPEHQDYLLRNPHGYTCHFPRPDWKLPEG